jgi:hypothetical protein
MPRMTININQPNVEVVEFTANEVKAWVDNPKVNDIQDRLELALDEAQADIENESNETQYVVIKVVK